MAGPLPTDAPSRVRILLLSPHARVLLIKYRNTGRSGAENPCWTTAGGGIEQGETIAAAARREIAEETGLTAVRLGPVVWYGEDSHRSGDWGITFKEHFVVAHSASEELHFDQWTEHERRQILEMRWWELEALRSSEERIYPFGLARLLEPILAGEYPSSLLVLPSI